MSVQKPVPKLQRAPETLTEMPSVAIASDGDLSRAVELTVPRVAGDRVRCARVFETYYRCNWWSAAGAGTVGAGGPVPEWAATSLHRIRRSRFLRVTQGADGLCIEEVAGQEPGANN